MSYFNTINIIIIVFSKIYASNYRISKDNIINVQSITKLIYKIVDLFHKDQYFYMSDILQFLCKKSHVFLCDYNDNNYVIFKILSFRF